MRAELERYRQQLGFLKIPENEADKIHAIKIESENKHEWRYRIYLPPQGKYTLKFAKGRLPGKTIELSDPKDYYAVVSKRTSGSSRSWEAGEFVLVFRIEPDDSDPDRRNWKFSTRRVGEGSKGSTTLTVPWMNDERAWSASSSMVGSKQKVYEPDQPLPLLTVRRAKITETVSGGYSAISADAREYSDGFMLWIHPK